MRISPWLLAAVLGGVLGACGNGTTTPRADPSVPAAPVTETARATPEASPAPRKPRADPAPDDVRPQALVPTRDDEAPVAPDLHRLATRFVRYAFGEADDFPHADSVTMALGGQTVLAIDDLEAALSNREIWRICPADWEVYGAASCPIDLLAPVADDVGHDAALVASGEHGSVICAPARSGPLPPGRLVVLRPARRSRTCVGDFALVLAADSQGRLTGVDLTLAEP